MAAQLFAFAFRAMGSPCELQLFANDADDARRIFEDARADVERLEQRYSRYRANSLLSRLNRVAARGGCARVDAETAQLLEYAATCHRESDGLFDVTSGKLREAWRFEGDALPDPELVRELLTRVGWEKLSWSKPVLRFQRGMEIDFGGIVKEYAVDRVAEACRTRGAASALVNLGGDVRVMGARPDGAPWRVGVRHPRDPLALLDALAMREGAIATSGDYERCIVVDGVRYGHILNPRSGWPVRRLAAVTVVADLCVVAGSAATIGMLKDDAGPQWLARLGLPHLWVDTAGNVGGTLA